MQYNYSCQLVNLLNVIELGITSQHCFEHLLLYKKTNFEVTCEIITITISSKEAKLYIVWRLFDFSLTFY